MRRVRLLILPLVAVALLAGCASAGGGGGNGGGPEATDAPARRRGGRNLIIRDELTGQGFADLMVAIRRLRPAWLRTRASSTAGGVGASAPAVFIDNVRGGDLSRLETIDPDMVESIRFINSRDATTRWGTNMSAGAIEVIMRR